MGIGKYLRAAFMNRWNILAMFAGMGAAVISGRPDVVAPIVLAGEVAYLGLLGTHPKFQKYVDASDSAVNRQQKSSQVSAELRQILQALPESALSRFERLRAQCHELRQIAGDLKRSNATDDGLPFESFQMAGLDRLLWIFLRLQFSEFSLRRFLDRTNAQRIDQEILELQQRLDRLKTQDDSPHIQKIRRTLEDNLQTCRDRRANHLKAAANHELVGLEIDRLENKIKSLAELAVNRQEPDYISDQVDQVASSMLETEKTMNELQFATGLAPMEEVPELLEPPPAIIIE